MKNKELTQTTILELQGVLDQYFVLFDEPQGLPPKRAHDHQIPLKDESQVIKIRPYRHPTIQKDEIKKMIADMKLARIIKDNHSFFISPVVFVITVSRSTWKTKNKSMESPPIFFV